MKVIDSIAYGEFNNRIVISILLEEKNPFRPQENLLKLPRFQAAAKQLLSRAGESNDRYILIKIDHSPENFKSSIYTFIWIKK